jgi:hypothetical protein
MTLQERFVSIKKTIDAELIRTIITSSGLLRQVQPEEVNDAVILELSKKILKDMLRNGNSIIRKNRDGFSISYTSDKITELCTFFQEANTLIRELRGGEEASQISQFMNDIYNPRLDDNGYFSRSSNIHFNVSDKKVLFYVRFSNHYQPSFYSISLVYTALFELVHLIEDYEQKVEELPRFYAMREQVGERMEAARREEERRQSLLRQGFSRDGISLGERLQEILNRRGGR